MTATLDESSTLAEALDANLVATGTRTARHAGGSSCAVCSRAVQAGERIADLADGRGIVHVLNCVTAAAVPPRASAPAAGRRRGASRGRTAP